MKEAGSKIEFIVVLVKLLSDVTNCYLSFIKAKEQNEDVSGWVNTLNGQQELRYYFPDAAGDLWPSEVSQSVRPRD